MQTIIHLIINAITPTITRPSLNNIIHRKRSRNDSQRFSSQSLAAGYKPIETILNPVQPSPTPHPTTHTINHTIIHFIIYRGLHRNCV